MRLLLANPTSAQSGRNSSPTLQSLIMKCVEKKNVDEGTVGKMKRVCKLYIGKIQRKKDKVKTINY